MDRRGFLGAMLAAASAPAIVRAESLMKIAVPKEKKLLLRNLAGDFDGDTARGYLFEPGSFSGHDWYMGEGGPRFDRAVFPGSIYDFSNMEYDSDSKLLLPSNYVRDHVKPVKIKTVKNTPKRKFFGLFS
jgi:hypothetical protein